MAVEIERKFLVVNESFISMARGHKNLIQGYLSTDPERTVRVRINDDSAWLTIKSLNHGATRGEWEYAIPVEDARQLIKLCGDNVIEKVRHYVDYAGLTWEIDVFGGSLAPLILAEVELTSEFQSVTLPPFIGAEVTGDPQYYNSNLAGIKL